MDLSGEDTLLIWLCYWEKGSKALWWEDKLDSGSRSMQLASSEVLSPVPRSLRSKGSGTHACWFWKGQLPPGGLLRHCLLWQVLAAHLAMPVWWWQRGLRGLLGIMRTALGAEQCLAAAPHFVSEAAKLLWSHCGDCPTGSGEFPRTHTDLGHIAIIFLFLTPRYDKGDGTDTHVLLQHYFPSDIFCENIQLYR